jgi:hypothetical protein
VSVEDQNAQEATNREDMARDHSLDALAKGLANGSVSRRKALKLMGSALIGGLLAAVPGVALADHKPGHGSGGGGGGDAGPKCKPLDSKCATNQDCCSRYCDKNGRICACPPNETLCNRQCVACPNIGEIVNPTTCQCECPANIPEVCGNQCLATCTAPKIQRNPQTCACECPTGTTECGNNCCAEGTECCQGQCRAVCAPTEQRNPQSCACEAVGCTGARCATYFNSRCNDNPNCFCLTTAEGGGFCYDNRTFGTCTQPCSSTQECPSGSICVVDTCCGSTCLPIAPHQCGAGDVQTPFMAAETSGNPLTGLLVRLGESDAR